MPEIRFIFGAEKRKIVEKLGYYGIEKLNYLLSSAGKEKVRGYTGSLSTDEILELNKEIGIQLLGMYLFHDFREDFRISFDAVHALKDQISDNIIELEEKQVQEFMKGHDILLNEEDKKRLGEESKGFKIIRDKKNQEFIGTGKLVEGRIVNYMPKERRLR